ncbi:RNA-binding protein 39 [Nucella lapillus]
MAEDFDVEAMLEAPYKKEEIVREEKTSSSSKSKKKKKRSRSRERSNRDRRPGNGVRRSRSRDRDRRERRRSGSRPRGRRDDRDRRRSPPRTSRRRSRSRERLGRRAASPLRNENKIDMTPEERDARTVFCMQLSARIRARDLEEFFSSVGKVTDVRLITDNKSRRSKGIAYVEFKDIESVTLAMALTGQKLLAVPILVQPSQAEKNRLFLATSMMASSSPPSSGPIRLYVGSLHFNITEEMLKGIFEPFGKVDDVKLIKDHENGRSQGYGFLTFRNPDNAKKALEQLNGFELAGRAMKVGHVTERMGLEGGGTLPLDTDEMDRAGIDLGATGRLQLMAKLAEGTGFQIPQYAASALTQMGTNGSLMNMPQPFSQLPSIADPANGPPPSNIPAPPITTQCFMLSNMFDYGGENRLNWDQEVRDDVIEECIKHGGVFHIYVDQSSPQGSVYVKCPTIAAAAASVNALHGRYFGGRVITAAYVPLPNYSALFPDSVRAIQPLMSSGQSLQSNFSSSFSMHPTL